VGPFLLILGMATYLQTVFLFGFDVGRHNRAEGCLICAFFSPHRTRCFLYSPHAPLRCFNKQISTCPLSYLRKQYSRAADSARCSVREEGPTVTARTECSSTTIARSARKCVDIDMAVIYYRYSPFSFASPSSRHRKRSLAWSRGRFRVSHAIHVRSI
jgi:hypothetical protein